MQFSCRYCRNKSVHMLPCRRKENKYLLPLRRCSSLQRFLGEGTVLKDKHNPLSALQGPLSPCVATQKPRRDLKVLPWIWHLLATRCVIHLLFTGLYFRMLHRVRKTIFFLKFIKRKHLKWQSACLFVVCQAKQFSFFPLGQPEMAPSSSTTVLLMASTHCRQTR